MLYGNKDGKSNLDAVKQFKLAAANLEETETNPPTDIST